MACGLFIARGLVTAFLGLASTKQNLCIFYWFLLYFPTVLHATMCISVGFGSGIDLVSVAIAMSFFRITVFFRKRVSIVIVFGV